MVLLIYKLQQAGILLHTGSFSVAAGSTLSLGITNTRLQMTLNSGSSGSISGTVTLFGGGLADVFTNSGNLTIGSAGIINSSGGAVTPTFVLSSGATLQIGSTSGISTAGTTGNILVPGTYSTGANYVYNGTAAQVTGNGLPATVSNLTINNTAGVTLPSAKTITNNLSITTGAFLNLGTFTHSAGTLTLGGAGQLNGSWGSTASSATHKNDTYFASTATGIVNVTTSTCTPPAAPTVTSPVNYCQNSTASPLTATGSNLLWYTVPTGGTGSPTAPTPSTTSVGTTSYYVSQTVGCEGPRAQIVVNRHCITYQSFTKNDVQCFNTSTGQI